jgi:tetratricopeptide (TPR) repeat protein
MGKFEAAVSCYERALTVAREHGDRVNEAIWLGNIGSVYGDLGYGARAIEHHEQALAIDRDLKNKFGESRHLDNLADEYLVVGQGARALEHRQRALAIDRELKHPQEEAHRLANLGHTQFKLGNNVEARECLTEGHRIAERIGYRLIEMASLTFLGELLVDEGDLEGAVEKLRLSIDLADNAGVTQFQSEARIALARVHLYRTELTAARKAADAARQFDFPSSNDGACLAAGIIAVRQGDQDGAREALGAALRQADSLLSRNPQRVSSLDVKGLALCGLSLCDHIKHLSGARDAFAAARAPGFLAGSVRQVLRLFDALAAADTVGALQELRAVAAGAAPQTRTV